ncbi:hypothetical protein PBI_GAIA_41 [Mycobacterium phage Gaia]|uniref:Uncharacterized protein n=1 Tax=Mycobacterium phage Gaia TaxID=1486472 RepID=A0A068F4J1_9CAUD|nr:hypothetical protein VC46_gp041 [Mycobacterium phage Gaia]AID58861.1 hypothetical protein PBI_GAIA_41 [Mycobacterium phage Gaia]
MRIQEYPARRSGQRLKRNLFTECMTEREIIHTRTEKCG